MLNKNSMFVRVLVPVIAVMLIQTLLVSMVLFVNGTISSIKDESIGTLHKNVENRSITLENMMVHNMSNLEMLENDMTSVLEKYLTDNDVSIDEVLSSYEHETNLLYQISDPLISALRKSMSTGVYMYFIDDEYNLEKETSCNGLYYRDLNPVYTPADNSDILFLRGFVDVARKNKIQLDSLWSEIFVFSPENKGMWESNVKPLYAAKENPGLSANDLAYWNTPHLIDMNDSNECITYSKPYFYDGRLIAMIGSEMQVEQLKKYFPATDFDISGKGGYMIIKYNSGDMTGDALTGSIYAVTGSYIDRMFAAKNVITLKKSDKENIYTLLDNQIEDVHFALQAIRLYNTNAPFSNEQWALSSVGTDDMLFESSKSVVSGILFSSAIALFIAIALLAFIIKISIRPLISITDQIRTGDPDDPIIITNSDTSEIAILSSTINAMKAKRRKIEEELREERERYLIALESAADTFMEYDVEQDSFMLYYFLEQDQKPELFSKVIESFTQKLKDEEICHKEDIFTFLDFIKGGASKPVEIRALASLFSHIDDVEPDGDYYWFLLKGSFIYGDDGSLKKIIGITQQITEEKKRENARIEAQRHDATTGFYNSEYGMNLMKKRIFTDNSTGSPFAVCAIHIKGFDILEAHYGRVFGGIVLMRLCREITALKKEREVDIRFSNDCFILFIPDIKREEIQEKMYLISDRLSNMYIGEDPNLKLSLSIGAALSTDDTEPEGILKKSCQAMLYATKPGIKQMVFFDTLLLQSGEEYTAFRNKPISVSLDASKEGIVGLSFSLFENTTNIQSAINILLITLGEVFSLKQVIVCEYDSDFRANKVMYQWNAPGVDSYHLNVEKVLDDDIDTLENMLDENASMQFNTDNIKESSEGVRRLLCLSQDESVSGFVCVMYEGGANIGRILFKSDNEKRIWTENEMQSLHEIVKIIAAQISIEKSNSASRAKSEFLSRMSHEIRTPMNAIIGMNRIAMESVNDEERLNDCLEKIDFSAKHLLALINDVLEMSRIESGKLKIDSEAFALKGLIDDVEILMRPQIEGKGITFRTELKCTHYVVISDEYRLKQVLVNFLGNAVKFTEAGGAISLVIEEQGQQDEEFGIYRFSVKDSGIGISKEDQQSVFKEFEQVGDGKFAKKNGTGLGLAISSSIINAMNGRIELASEVGKGAEFYFVLKMKLGDENIKVLSREEEDMDYSQYFKGKKVLLVEDNEINIEVAAHILYNDGFEVDVARTGKEALDMFFASGQEEYDVILMDIQMPVMDGLTATREIRKDKERPDAVTIPIIAMTADAFSEDMKKSIEAGMNGHIAKPVDNKKLCALLRQLLYIEKR